MNNFISVSFKSIVAAVFIGFGVACKLLINNVYISSILFAFGLFCVCVFSSNLFTGKCGYAFDSKENLKQIGIILVFNLIGGYIFGMIMATAYPQMTEPALKIVNTWDCSFSYFLKSVFCGMIMFSAVDAYKKGSVLGIFYGVPLFLLCGFQHSIANVIIMGAGFTMNIFPLLICIIGNWIGSLLIEVYTTV